jgi:hypothetical protein
VELDRIEVARAFVEHVAGDGGKARPLARIGSRADRQQNEEADQRNGVVLDREDANAIRKLSAANLGEPEPRVRTERWQAGSIDGHHATATG